MTVDVRVRVSDIVTNQKDDRVTRGMILYSRPDRPVTAREKSEEARVHVD